MGTICIYYRQCPYFGENCYKGDGRVAIEYDCKIEKGAENEDIKTNERN